MTRFVIIGAGAVGSSLAAQLEGAGAEYILVARDRQAAHLREHGLTYIRPDGTSHLRLAVTTFEDHDGLRSDDLLVFTPKTQDLDAALVQWAWRPVVDAPHLRGADLPVLTLQNGLEAERRALRSFRTVYGATVNMPGAYVDEGVVEVRAAPAPAVVTVGAYPERPVPEFAPVARTLRDAGYVVEVVDHLTRWKTAKLLWNVKNGIEVFSQDAEQAQEVGDRLVGEARAVFLAAGLDVADPKRDRSVDTSPFQIAPRPAGTPGGQSTWQSFARPTAHGQEADFLNGEIVFLGRIHGVPTPYNEAVQRLLGEAFEAREAPGTRSVDALIDLARRLEATQTAPVSA